MTAALAPGALVLTNRGAGGVDDDVVAAVLGAARPHGPVDVVDVREVDGRGAQLRGRAAGRPVVLLGGDGTVHRVVQDLHDAQALGDVVLVVAPGGSGNDLAGALGLDDEPAAVVGACLAGLVQDLDLVVDDHGVVCVNVAHVGAGLEVSERAAGLKDHLGAVGLPGLAYPLAGAVEAVGGPRTWHLTVRADEAVVHSDDVALVAVANGRRFGGGAARLGSADLSDGHVVVLVARADSVLDRAALAVALLADRVPDLEAVGVHRASEVVVEGDAARWVVDGEPDDEPRSSRRWSVRPGAWRVLLPR